MVAKDQPEARSSPGIDEGEEAEECDWSEEEKPAGEPVEAIPARSSGSGTKEEPKIGEDVEMGEEAKLEGEDDQPVLNHPASSTGAPNWTRSAKTPENSTSPWWKRIRPRGERS